MTPLTLLSLYTRSQEKTGSQISFGTSRKDIVPNLDHASEKDNLRNNYDIRRLKVQILVQHLANRSNWEM